MNIGKIPEIIIGYLFIPIAIYLFLFGLSEPIQLVIIASIVGALQANEVLKRNYQKSQSGHGENHPQS